MGKTHRQVNSVLVGTGNQAPLGAANRPEDLATGQTGIFTPAGASIVTGGATTEFFVGVKTSTGFIRSGIILRGNVRSATVSCYNAAVAPIVDVTNLCTQCSEDVVLRVQIYDSRGFVSQGFSPFMKSFTYSTDCCTTPGETIDCVAMVIALRDAMNNDPEGLFTVIATDPATDLELDDTALGTWDYEASGCPNLRITTNAVSIADFCGIPYTYVNTRGTNISVAFETNGCCDPAVEVVTATDIEFSAGSGIDVKVAEWLAAGNDALGPFRMAGDVVFSPTLNAAAATNYHLITIEYDEPMESGFIEYSDPKSLTIAIPTTAANAFTLTDYLDLLLGTALEAALDAC